MKHMRLLVAGSVVAVVVSSASGAVALDADPLASLNNDLFAKVDKIAKRLGLKECN